jgi:hypothetical protein
MVTQTATTAGWKKLVSTSDTITYCKEKGDHSIIIEARHYDSGWEIVKKYTGDDLNFTEQYTATTEEELKNLIARLRGERELSTNEIRTIGQFRKKQLKIDLKRAYQERGVEKWVFAFNGSYTNHVIIRYGRQIAVDVVMEEKLKYIEEKIVMKLFESFGLDQSDADTELSIYYYTKKANYFFESDEEEIVMG